MAIEAYPMSPEVRAVMMQADALLTDATRRRDEAARNVLLGMGVALDGVTVGIDLGSGTFTVHRPDPVAVPSGESAHKRTKRARATARAARPPSGTPPAGKAG